ncbi:MAG: hypothetical protein LBC37_07720 [Zoogloeaceae bacterium]|jgi:hypothetical protein|nr:hypothetical protein [Zoogloeaceae bacterium]
MQTKTVRYAAKPEALDYFRREGLDRYFSVEAEYALSAYDAIDPANKVPYPPDVDDLVRLHRLIRERRVLTVLEFGVGFSTIVMADALAKNKADHEADFLAEGIRCLYPFSLFSVDADANWIGIVQKNAKCMGGGVNFLHSAVHIGTFHDRLCHYYDALPDVMPDFIYLDGPAGDQVVGHVDGSSFAGNMERTVMSADLLRLEPTLTPGTFILVDGRVNNARFLRNNFQREWKMLRDDEADITTFELCEPPLGVHNRRRLKFQGLIGLRA